MSELHETCHLLPAPSVVNPATQAGQEGIKIAFVTPVHGVSLGFDRHSSVTCFGQQAPLGPPENGLKDQALHLGFWSQIL